MVSSWWPVFDIEVLTPDLCLKALTDEMIPELLEVIHAGVHPTGVETGSFPPTHLSGMDLERVCVLAWWSARVNWTPSAWHLDLVAFERSEPGRPIGMQSIRAQDFATDREVSTMSWLSRDRHGQGLGKEIRLAALAFAFDGLVADKVVSGAERSNLASKGVSFACGYEFCGVETIETDNGPLVLDRFETTSDRWRQLQRLPVTVNNLGPARADFIAVDATNP